MSKLSAGEIAYYAQQAGFSTAESVAAVGIALAESGGDTQAHNSKPPDDSYGLWQINMLGALGPERRKKYGLSSNDALYDPATNARVAYGIYKDAGAKFTPWSTYTNRSYLAGTRGRTAAAAASSPTKPRAEGDSPFIPNAIEGPADAAADAAHATVDVLKWITTPANILRIVYVTGGIAVIIAGLSYIGSQSKIATDIKGTVVGATKKVATKGVA